MVAPTLLAHGTDEAKQHYLRALWRGDLIGCQLFSEPEAGSDLANIKTRAVPDGDEWVVNGQKVWTSGAHYSDLGILLSRTSVDPDKRHHGLTMFLVDLASPGIDIRPLRQMTGGTSFNEVFLSDVRIPDWHRLGEIDDGWRVAMTTLMNERAAIGGGSASSGFSTTRRLFELARHTGLNEDLVVRQELAQLWIRSQITRYSRQRTAARLRAGQAPGPEKLDRQAVPGPDAEPHGGDRHQPSAARIWPPTPASGASTPGPSSSSAPPAAASAAAPTRSRRTSWPSGSSDFPAREPRPLHAGHRRRRPDLTPARPRRRQPNPST